MSIEQPSREAKIGNLAGLDWSSGLDAVDWGELSALYLAAPLGNKAPLDLKTVFQNSLFRFFVRDGGRLVGAGRALADGVDCSYICDIAVHPGHQGCGVGKEIVGRLVEASRGHRKIILYSVPGREPFYAKFGFRRMATAMAIFANQEQAAANGYLTRD
ncbi:MAG: GNAT family N-acetyltransferase [Burkholderiaceae bacterium]